MVVNDAAVFEKFSIDFNAMDVPHKKQHIPFHGYYSITKWTSYITHAWNSIDIQQTPWFLLHENEN